VVRRDAEGAAATGSAGGAGIGCSDGSGPERLRGRPDHRSPSGKLSGFIAKASPLAGPNGATIPVEQIQLLRVAYVRANVPTDKLGLADEWPDPLPPFDSPIDVDANRNQPVWLLIHVPGDAVAGIIAGR